MRKLSLDEAAARFAAVYDDVRISSPGPAARLMTKVSIFLRDHGTAISVSACAAALLAGATSMFNAGMLIDHGISPVPEFVQQLLRPFEHMGMKSIGHFYDMLSAIGRPGSTSLADMMPSADAMNPKDRFLGGFVGMMESAGAAGLLHKLMEHFETNDRYDRRTRLSMEMIEARDAGGVFYIGLTRNLRDRKGRHSATIAIYDRPPVTTDDAALPVVTYELKSERYLSATIHSFLNEIAPTRVSEYDKKTPADEVSVDAWIGENSTKTAAPAV